MVIEVKRTMPRVFSMGSADKRTKMHPSESKQGLSITRKYTFAPQPEQRGGDAAGAGERGATCRGQTWLYPLNLALQSAAVTVLLGATQAGKTSLMRIMAGLDAHQRRVRWMAGM
jgi:ABC-type multidrug transport system ATPase subunit